MPSVDGEAAGNAAVGDSRLCALDGCGRNLPFSAQATTRFCSDNHRKLDHKRRARAAGAAAAGAEPAETNESLLLSDKYVVNKATGTVVTFLSSAPKPIVLPLSKHKAILKAYSNWAGKPSSIQEIARRFDFPRQWLVEYLRTHGMTHDTEPFMPEEVLEQNPEALVEEVLQSRRQNLYQAVEKAKWKAIQNDSDELNRLKQGLVQPLVEMFKDIGHARPVTKLQKPPKDGLCLLTHATDLHVGLRTHPGSRDPYDIAICEQRLMSTTDDIINQSAALGVSLTVLGVGGDFMHYDGFDQRTTSGVHHQESGVTWEEMFREAVRLAVLQIDKFRQLGHVDVVVVPGNHANLSEIAMGVALEAWYRNSSDVAIHSSPDQRVYTQFGKTLCCWHHGHNIKNERLPAVMASEEPKAWGECPFRIAIRGHWHHAMVHDAFGVTQFQFPTLAGLDEYHSTHGWTMATPGLAGIVLDAERGPKQLLFSNLIRDFWRGTIEEEDVA